MDKLRFAMFAVPSAVLGGYAVWQVCKYMSSQIIRRKLDTGRKPDKIYLVTTPSEWELIYPTIVKHTEYIKVVGLDCEWVMDRGKGVIYPVALIQLATYQGLCILVRINHMTQNIPKSLLKLLGDKSILKVGVAVKDDGKRLYKDYGIIVQGCVDLRHVLSRVRGHYHCKSRGLKGLAEGTLGFTIQKDPVIRCGNWETAELSERQIEYAALDALVGIDIYIKLIITKLLGYIPNRKQLDMQAFSITDFNATCKSVCQGLVDIAYKRNIDDLSLQHPASNGTNNKKGRVDMLRAYLSRKRPLYHNCHLEAPDGQMLCTCDQRKAEWYIHKGLGVKITDDPLTVRLKFEPSGRPESQNNYYLQDKDNVCVVCGRSESYIRKFIVPQEYRKHLLHVLKFHAKHDVVLLCPSCHQISGHNDVEFRLQLALECDAPLDKGNHFKAFEDKGLLKIKSAAKALTINRSKIPEKRIEELEQTLMDHFAVDCLSEQLLQEAMDMDIRIYNAEYIPHAQKVVNYMKENEGLLEFEKRWRKHFIEKMNPKFLPAFWSVDHTHQQVVKLYGLEN